MCCAKLLVNFSIFFRSNKTSVLNWTHYERIINKFMVIETWNDIFTHFYIVGHFQYHTLFTMGILHGISAFGGITNIHAFSGTLKIFPTLQEYHFLRIFIYEICYFVRCYYFDTWHLAISDVNLCYEGVPVKLTGASKQLLLING